MTNEFSEHMGNLLDAYEKALKLNELICTSCQLTPTDSSLRKQRFEYIESVIMDVPDLTFSSEVRGSACLKVATSTLVSFPQDYNQRNNGQNPTTEEMVAWRDCVKALTKKIPTELLFTTYGHAMQCVGRGERLTQKRPINGIPDNIGFSTAAAFWAAYELTERDSSMMSLVHQSYRAVSDTALWGLVPYLEPIEEHIVRMLRQLGNQDLQYKIHGFSGPPLSDEEREKADDVCADHIKDVIQIYPDNKAIGHVFKEIVAYVGRKDLPYNPTTIAQGTIKYFLEETRPEYAKSRYLDPLLEEGANTYPSLHRLIIEQRAKMQPIRSLKVLCTQPQCTCTPTNE